MTDLNREAVLKVYRGYAPLYDLLFGRLLEAGRAAMAAHVPADAQRLLEVGVGTGLALPRYPRSAQIVGLDLSPDMLARARARVRDGGLQDHTGQAPALLCADAEQLPFKDASFDCITLPYVLSVTPNPARLLAELRRVCRTGGRVLILNHFSGAGVWGGAERLLAGLAHRVGFNSRLPISVLDQPGWTLAALRSVNLLGLSKLAVLSHDPA
ncbi:class I SAM-dependent methyltransferase [Aquimonas voraii]|uniref:Phosphatidylethanolamine N-methyltransferase /phosphatidyl-N-methylethanolamine N-methyltransferase n=1 Tax=Aquimonas voraii TaxID=265719 RepID=A0A1G6S1J7_9GAMM|nr:methyltransferase domain-containing protein [Aquimonas voraii]SDD10708.1 phosphatidylethanolamine N-methyltransferase /phosphatidyl-N-methylethanolamine N-methyltransferase [Aquimonas voraii]